MVFASVCKRKGADPDILETLMEDTEVLAQTDRVGERPPGESSQGGA